jgi:shikimate kinase
VPDRPSIEERVLLIGMMGAGKSTVGRLVATRLGCDAVDTDDLVERSSGMTVADMFAALGEDSFRAAEAGAIRELGHGAGALVVSVGGGAVLKGENREAMRALGTVVWLRAQPGTLAARVGRGQGRPLLAGDSEHRGTAAVLAGLASERHALYEQVADIIIDVDHLSPAQVARLVMAELERRRR